MKFVNDIKGLEVSCCDSVDCYLSCDSAEAGKLLEGVGFFKSVDYVGSASQSFLDDYERLGGHTNHLTNSNGSTAIDCVNIPLEEDLRAREDLDFPSQSKLRIYTEGKPNINCLLGKIEKIFCEELYKIAFVGIGNGKAYIPRSALF